MGLGAMVMSADRRTLNTGDLISQVFPLDSAGEAFGEAMKVVAT